MRIKVGISCYYCTVPVTNMANYEVVDGMRKDSKIYVHENKRYSIIKKYENHVRLRCSQYKNLMCPGTAVIKDDRLTIVKQHNHDDDDREILIMPIKNKIKKAVGEGTENVRAIYDTVMGTYPNDVKQSVPWNIAGERQPCPICRLL